MGLIFFTAITTATVPFQRALSGPRMQRVLDRITGVVLILFALLLLFERRTV
ncbi:LysE family transporter [Pseudomonas chlororaphis]|nr:LysE family transporter [Pseudomonas chlororaphis]